MVIAVLESLLAGLLVTLGMLLIFGMDLKFCLLLGAVATDPRARGRGCASRLVKALASEQNGRAALVFCRSDGLEEFYKKCGFCRIGKWATACLHD